MDFLGRLFGISPDHGSGISEVILLLAIAAVPLAVEILRKRSKFFSRRTP